MWLDDLGVIYYMPAFLLYFSELRHLDLEYYTRFICDLEDGLIIKKSSYLNVEIENSHAPFECLTKEQSKLVALFLINAANLYPSNYSESIITQQALKNYWGKFLLI